MKLNRTNIYTLIIILILVGCKNTKETYKKSDEVNNTKETDSKFGEVKDITGYKQTEFTPTLEHTILKDKNTVYCATLLFAWDGIRNHQKSTLMVDEKYDDLSMINQSTSYKNTLKQEEYSVNATIEQGELSVIAKFNKSLPFSIKLEEYKNKLTFDGQKVSSFGVSGFSSEDKISTVKILYYKNDNEFIIKLLPKEKEHEIILFKTLRTYNSFTEATAKMNELIKIGVLEKQKESLKWKYIFNAEDIVVIPMFKFNIQKEYSSLIGNSFSKKGEGIDSGYIIVKAEQTTGFILNESGAEIESKAEIDCCKSDAPDVEEEKIIIKPKNMFFDKVFTLLLKRKDNNNPYFAMQVLNSELMIKE